MSKCARREGKRFKVKRCKSTEDGYKMMLFVQQRLYEGLLPDENGYYTIRRREFVDRLPISQSSFETQIGKLVNWYMQEWDLFEVFGLVGLEGENLYTDVYYQGGKLRFKRNPYTLREDLCYVWARKPSGWEERQFLQEAVPVAENVVLPLSTELRASSKIYDAVEAIAFAYEDDQTVVKQIVNAERKIREVILFLDVRE